jgi:hypothetical protein
MKTIQVRVSSADKSFPGEARVEVDGSLSVADAKKEILRQLHLSKLRTDQILLLFRSEANIDLKFASSPFSGSGKEWLLVVDEKTLGSFLQGRTLIQFILYED